MPPAKFASLVFFLKIVLRGITIKSGFVMHLGFVMHREERY